MKTKTKSMLKSIENQSAQQECVVGTAGDQVCSREQMVAEAAYYLSEQRGFSSGKELDDWLAAQAYISTLCEEGTRHSSRHASPVAAHQP